MIPARSFSLNLHGFFILEFCVGVVILEFSLGALPWDFFLGYEPQNVL